jgi:hypothetical protein
MMNPATNKKRRVLIALIPFFIAVPCIITGVLLWHGRPVKNPPSVLFMVMGTILVFDISACIYVFVKWLRAGEPPALSLCPLFFCRVEREFRRALRERPKLSNDEFYDAYYSDSGISRQLPGQLRKSLEDALGMDLAALHPDDNLMDADHEVDWGDVLWRIERKYKVVVPIEAFVVDGTFDSLLRHIVEGNLPESGSAP